MNLLTIIKNIIGSLFTTEGQALTKDQILNQLQQIDLKQIELNALENAKGNLYSNGWRPAAGWICVIALSYNYILYPIFDNILSRYDIFLLPIETGELWTLLFGMLGLGTLRTYEKTKLVGKK